MRHPVFPWMALALLFVASGCAVQRSSYDAFRAHQPRSILVLPPLNDTVEVGASPSFLASISRPVGEAGYYVFPVAVVDAFMRDNGLPTPADMHGVPLDKLRDVFGADAVLYLTVEAYGQKYLILSSATVASVHARLVDTHTGLTLWQGRGQAREESGGSDNIVGALVEAVVTQVIKTTVIDDPAHPLTRQANEQLVLDETTGFLLGPYRPDREEDRRGLASE